MRGGKVKYIKNIVVVGEVALKPAPDSETLQMAGTRNFFPQWRNLKLFDISSHLPSFIRSLGPEREILLTVCTTFP